MRDQVPGAGQVVGLVRHGTTTAAPSERFEPTRVGLDHTAFHVGSRAELDAWAGFLAEAGVEPWNVVDVPPGAILKHLDGVALGVFWGDG